MASQSDTFTVQASLESVWKACEEAVGALGCKVVSKVDNSVLVCKEAMGAYLVYAMPVEVEIRLSRVTPVATQISLKGSNFGVGPIAGNHIKGHLSNLRMRIETLSSRG